MKTIKKISVLTHVLITALIIKDEFYLTNALLLPGLKILISLSFFLWYIIIAASDVLIEVSSRLWGPGTRSMIHNVLVVCGEGVLWTLSNETPSICFHMKACAVSLGVQKSKIAFYLRAISLTFWILLRMGSGLSSPCSHECTTEAARRGFVRQCCLVVVSWAGQHMAVL